MSREADNLDLAAELQDAFNQQGVRRALQETQQQTSPDFDGKHCVDCGDPVPAARLDLGRMRCVACQEAIERKMRSYCR